MTARRIIVPGAMPSRDANGRNLPAKLRFYVAGTALDTPASVYTSNTLSVAHPFPILSDASGRFPAIWADDANTFDVAWSDQVYDRVIETYAGLSPLSDATLASVALAEAAADDADAAQAAAEAAQAQAEALLASATGEPFSATSTTSLTIGTGSKSLTLAQTGKLFTTGQTVVIASTASPTNQMSGVITAFNATTGAMTVSVSATNGSGTLASWTVALTVLSGVSELAGLTGTISASAARTALDVITTAEVKAFAVAFAVSL